MQDIIITALGIKQSKRDLGYATQQISGESLVHSRETNIVAALSGKVAGLQVISAAGVPGASAFIKLCARHGLVG